MQQAWCHVCRRTVDTFVRSTAKEIIAPALGMAAGGALAYGTRRRAGLGDVLLGAFTGLAATAAINAASRAAQDLFCGTCHTHLRRV